MSTSTLTSVDEVLGVLEIKSSSREQDLFCFCESTTACLASYHSILYSRPDVHKTSFIETYFLLFIVSVIPGNVPARNTEERKENMRRDELHFLRYYKCVRYMQAHGCLHIPLVEEISM